MFNRINCPYCKEKVKKDAIRCRHCQAKLAGNGNAAAQHNIDEEGIRHLKNGFEKIHSECEAIEEKMKLKTGFVFIKHQYSSDELFYAISRIESFVDNLRDDLDEMESANNFSRQVRILFNKKAEEVSDRLESLQLLIEQREPTWWEKVSSLLKRIVEKILSIFPLEMFAGNVMVKMTAAA